MTRTLDAVLDLWAKDYPIATIVSRTGSTPGSIYVMVHKARKRGDRRAKPRAFATRPMTHHSRDIYRTREQTRALKESVLDAWAAGGDGDAVAGACGIDREYVHSLVRRARLAGDPRAALKRAPNWDGDGRTLRDTVLTLHDAGMRIGSIAAICEVTPKRAGEQLSRAGLGPRSC